jgi:DNA-binding MarR family transcriptional regulator
VEILALVRKKRKAQPRPAASHKSASRAAVTAAVAPRQPPVYKTGLRASALAPDDATLREFMADFHAAMSVMRLLRQEIASTLLLSSAEFSVLLGVWYLEREGKMTVRAIADHLHVAAAHVTAEVGKLVDMGLLTKQADPLDRRAVGIGLTAAARDAFQRLAPMLRDINVHLFAGVYYRDLLTVHRFLRSIIEHGYDAIKATEAYRPDAGSRPKRRKPRRANRR